MSKQVLTVILMMFGLSLTASVYSHPATERYIPIGYWASVSDRYTYIGEIKSHDADHTMGVEGPSGSRSTFRGRRRHKWGFANKSNR